MKFVRYSIIFSGMATMLFAGELILAAPPGVRSSISVVVEIQKGRKIYWINGKISRDPLSSLDILYAGSKNSVVEIMMDSRASFSQLGEAEGIVGKAGFKNIKYFVYSFDSGLRDQIFLKPAGSYYLRK